MAWASACCLSDTTMAENHHVVVEGEAAPHGVLHSQMMGDMDAPAEDAVDHCGGESSEAGMCCLAGVIGQAEIVAEFEPRPATWFVSLMAPQADPPVTGLFRPPIA